MEIDKMTMVTTKEEFKEYLLEFISTYKADIPKLVELEVSLRDEKNAFNEYPSTPKTPNLTAIRSTGEKAFQRGIINGKYSFLDYKNGNNEKVTWLDLELPVVLNQNPRRCCLDLLGSLDGISLLCELKFFEKTPSDHPIYGIVELLMYRYFIQCNYEKLDKYRVYHSIISNDFKWEDIVKDNSPILILAANKKYWEYWLKKLGANRLLKLLLDLNKRLGTNLHLFETSDEDFLTQKGNQVAYCPKVTNQQWIKVIHHF